jgi:hypothetical protein
MLGQVDEQQVRTLVAVVCERLAEIIPSSAYEVAVGGGVAIRIRALESPTVGVSWLTPVTLWQAQASVEDRLEFFLNAVAAKVQELLSTSGGRWPARFAEPRVLVDAERILVWWGGPSAVEAVVALRPIVRSEIGV